MLIISVVGRKCDDIEYLKVENDCYIIDHLCFQFSRCRMTAEDDKRKKL